MQMRMGLKPLWEEFDPRWMPREGWDHIEKTFGSVGVQMKEAYLAVLYGCARTAAIGRRKPVFVELGVWCGASAIALLIAAKELDGHVYSIEIDPNHEKPARERARRCNAEDRWTFICGDSRHIEPIKSDFLLVDADHDYESVCSDMARHGTAVRNGGVIVLDDYHEKFPGKVKWTQERWADIRPIIIGPYVIFYRLPYHNDTFTRQHNKDKYIWTLWWVT